VRLLDHEVELGLVMGRGPAIGTIVTDADLSHYIAGLVMSNDISARDLQLKQGQFYESKSYPTFTPTVPRLVLLDPEDFPRLSDCGCGLWVNGKLRQDGTAADVEGDLLPPATKSRLSQGGRRDHRVDRDPEWGAGLREPACRDSGRGRVSASSHRWSCR
jgi:Fumarylacetoacetate (FAA) hydrolase family